jgi:hypothetical protein
MRLNRALGNLELAGDFLVAGAPGDRKRDLALALGQ